MFYIFIQISNLVEPLDVGSTIFPYQNSVLRLHQGKSFPFDNASQGKHRGRTFS